MGEDAALSVIVCACATVPNLLPGPRHWAETWHGYA